MDNPTNMVNISGTCFDYVRVFSDGIWNEKLGESILQHSLVRFHLQVFLMVFIASFFHSFLKRFYFSRFISEILTGLLLGPTVLGRLFGDASKLLFPTAAPNQVFASLSKIGYILLTFLAAVRMDPSLAKKTGKAAIILGIFMFLFPFIMSNTSEVKFNKHIQVTGGIKIGHTNFAMLYLTAITGTQFVGVTTILMQLKITNSRLGHLALASALICELGKFIYGIVNSYRNAMKQVSPSIGLQSIFFSVALLLFILVPLKQIMFWFIRKTPEGKPMNELYASLTIATVFFLSSIGDSTGLNYLYGPFIFGLVVPAGSPLAKVLITKFDTIVTGYLVPIMVTFCATKFNLWQFFSEFSDTVNFKTALIGFMIKSAATFIMAICCKIHLREAAALTIIVNAKGVIEVGILLSYASLELMLIEATSGIFLVFLLSILQPPLIRKLYDPTKQYIGYRKKCIQHTGSDEELKILVCAQRQEDAVAAIKLLEYSNPTKQSPLSIYGLCLEELVSSATPLLINHQLGQKNSSSEGSRSQPIIDIFGYFNSQHKKEAQAYVYTAVSPLKQMHEDICWLSFERSCSLIILPFHKKWNSKGKMISSNHELRNLNNCVLGRAPCSVGILIDRRRNRGLSSIFATSTIYHVAVLFVGGPDDREALAYALRMAGSRRVQLSVMRFIKAHDHVNDRWESLLDSESLGELKHEMSRNTNISYVEKTVRDGSDTAGVVRSMEESYDLIMVGRRHETEPEAVLGLSEWVEMQELGPLGDMLASADFTSAVSVLVVQQQIMKASHSSILN